MLDVFDCKQIKGLLAKGATLVDVRSYYEFSQGALENACNMPINSFQYAADELDKDKPVLLYCRSGARSEMAKQYLQSLGFPEVYNIGSYNQLASCA